ncbi:4-hydroxy-tetrahydrodipicolinate reductase [Phenylobacterium sp.]|uniref:4-hydroxy-tetrahydrodipicolinate reductase n=1 Tax=Phenylobacterium sp. TaxID=1871053 RepID=UPI0028109F72|nr:4-hydroxy-tetrahydrodipicolinate reductase [Phenylobacterium sp.]
MADVIRIAIAGALGRMGKVVTAALADDPAFQLAGRFDRPGASGEGLVSADEAIAACDVIIDFTIAAASAELAPKVAAAGKALVIGSTGFDGAQLSAIGEAAKAIPIVRAGNFSLGLNMLMGLVTRAARALPPDAWDIEIVEAHHRRKVDAPSGAALMLGAAAADGRGVSLAQVARKSREGITGERPVGEIGFAAIRGGGVVGEHSVVFAAEDEILTLSHSARDRTLFARGALAAARWVAGRPPGEYDMQDVLGLKEA